jgi:hypothetical protein
VKLCSDLPTNTPTPSPTSDFILAPTRTPSLQPTKLFITTPGGNVYSTSPLKTLEIPISAQLSSYDNQTYAYKYTWKQQMNETFSNSLWGSSVSVSSHLLILTSTQTSSKNLVIPAGSTKWGQYYIFMVSVTYEETINNFTVVGIKIDDRPLPTARESQEILLSSYTHNEIKLTDMFDFFSDLKESKTWWVDVAPSEDEAILHLYHVTWNCTYELSTKVFELCRFSLSQFTNQLRITASPAEISNAFIVGNVYFITSSVESKETGEIAESTVSVIVNDAKYPVVRVFPETVSLASGEQMNFEVGVVRSQDIGGSEILHGKDISSFYNISWRTSPALTPFQYAFTIFDNTATLDTSVITNDLINRVVIYIDVNPLPIQDVESPVSKQVRVTINKPPRAGYCDVNPEIGIPFITKFVVMCADWLSNSTLRYQFGSKLINSSSSFFSPLVVYSQSASYEFMLGHGNYTIRCQIKDEYGATVEVFLNMSSAYDDNNDFDTKTADELFSIGDEMLNAASVGDVAVVLSNAALLNSGIELLKVILGEASSHVLISLKDEIINAFGTLLSSITPTTVTLEAVVSALSTTAADWTLISQNSVPMVAIQLETIISTMADFLSEEYVSKFSHEQVLKLVSTATFMLRATTLHRYRNMTTLHHLRNITKMSLRHSLIDTQPGQVGFSSGKVVTSSSYSAKRAPADKLSSCSSSGITLPDHIPEFKAIQSADCIELMDAEDFAMDIESRRIQNDLLIGQQIASIILYDSSEDVGNEAVVVGSLDTCEPILYMLDAEIIQGVNYERVAIEIEAAAAVGGSLDYALPSCASRNGFDDK